MIKIRYFFLGITIVAAGIGLGAHFFGAGRAIMDNDPAKSEYLTLGNSFNEFKKEFSESLVETAFHIWDSFMPFPDVVQVLMDMETEMWQNGPLHGIYKLETLPRRTEKMKDSRC